MRCHTNPDETGRRSNAAVYCEHLQSVAVISLISLAMLLVTCLAEDRLLLGGSGSGHHLLKVIRADRQW